MRIDGFRITRFQFARDRVIGDSQVRIDSASVAALELIADTGISGLGFVQSLFHPLPDQTEIERVFREEAWPALEGAAPGALIHQINRPRGGNRRNFRLPFEEAIQVALWDLAAKDAGVPLYRLLGGGRNRVRAYASGLDFHLSDDDFASFFARADALGYSAFKMKVGHQDFGRDLDRLALLARTVRPGAHIIIDANEAWSAKESLTKIKAIRRAGHDLLWVEDPVLRDDIDGLKMLRSSATGTLVNSGEYLDASGKRRLIEAGAVDMLNVHGHITDVMRVGWLAAEHNVPVTVGNTFLEFGVHVACALPEVEWLEYSFQNFAHLVDEPMEIRDGWIVAPERPGHGLVLSDAARRDWARPDVLSKAELGHPPQNPQARHRPVQHDPGEGERLATAVRRVVAAGN